MSSVNENSVTENPVNEISVNENSINENSVTETETSANETPNNDSEEEMWVPNIVDGFRCVIRFYYNLVCCYLLLVGWPKQSETI